MVNEKYIARCLQLAQLGKEWVAPNPMVGAVLVHNNRIIGEGFHRRFGDKHAEPNAIASVTDEHLLKDSTLYVNLEPCSHYGKTPPCAKLIIRKQIPRVVVGTLDPNPVVAGRGVQLLRDAGVDVTVGVLQRECRELNKRFFCFQEQKRPYITLKWAQTADGFIDVIRTEAAQPVLVVSNKLTKQLTHKLRAENMAIMVGTNTALLDDPGLRTTRWCGRNPVRVVIDKQLKIPAHYKLLQDDAPTIVFSEQAAYPFNTTAEVIQIHFDDNIWTTILHELYRRNIHSIIVEGGAFLLNHILKTTVWDEAQVEVSPQKIQIGVTAPLMPQTPCAMREYNGHKVFNFRNDLTS